MPAIVEFPQVVREAMDEFHDLFSCEPQRQHFAEYLTGLMVAANKTVTGINSEFVETTDQSCLNRFLMEVAWDEEALNERRLELLQRDPTTRYSNQGVIALDDTLIDHDGEFIKDVGWFWDHAEAIGLDLRLNTHVNQPLPTRKVTDLFHPQIVVAFDVTPRDAGEISSWLARRLATTPAIHATSPIAVSVVGTTATIRGEVVSERDRALIGQTAIFESEISSVRNLLTLKAPKLRLPKLPAGPSLSKQLPRQPSLEPAPRTEHSIARRPPHLRLEPPSQLPPGSFGRSSAERQSRASSSPAVRRPDRPAFRRIPD